MMSIEVLEEIQGANDPAPFWTHISLLRDSDKKKQAPGNLLKLKGTGRIAVRWQAENLVRIYLAEVLTPENEIPKTPITRGEIEILFIIGNPPSDPQELQ